MGTEKYTEGTLLLCDTKRLTLKPITDITLTTCGYSDIVEVEPDLVSGRIDKVVFNNPATIVFWKDGIKTVVKCQENDTFSKETGLAMCIVKKMRGNKGNFNELFKKYIENYWLGNGKLRGSIPLIPTKVGSTLTRWLRARCDGVLQAGREMIVSSQMATLD